MEFKIYASWPGIVTHIEEHVQEEAASIDGKDCYILVEMAPGVVATYSHLPRDLIAVEVGQLIELGDHLGSIRVDGQ